jgi:hypothetical protein
MCNAKRAIDSTKANQRAINGLRNLSRGFAVTEIARVDTVTGELGTVGDSKRAWSHRDPRAGEHLIDREGGGGGGERACKRGYEHEVAGTQHAGDSMMK